MRTATAAGAGGGLDCSAAQVRCRGSQMRGDQRDYPVLVGGTDPGANDLAVLRTNTGRGDHRSGRSLPRRRRNRVRHAPTGPDPAALWPRPRSCVLCPPSLRQARGPDRPSPPVSLPACHASRLSPFDRMTTGAWYVQSAPRFRGLTKTQTLHGPVLQETADSRTRPSRLRRTAWSLSTVTSAGAARPGAGDHRIRPVTGRWQRAGVDAAGAGAVPAAHEGDQPFWSHSL